MTRAYKTLFLSCLFLILLVDVFPFESASARANNAHISPSESGAPARTCSRRVQQLIDSSHPDATVNVWIFFSDHGDGSAPPGGEISGMGEVSPRASRRIMRRGSQDARREKLLQVFPQYIKAVSSYAVLSCQPLSLPPPAMHVK